MTHESNPEKAGGLLEWLWRGRALVSARAFRTEVPEKTQRRLMQAQRAAELAGRALDPIEPLRSGSSVGLALSLYREAAYWSLLAQDDAWEAQDLETAFAVAPPELLLFAAGCEVDLEKVRTALVSSDFIRTSELHPLEQAAEAARAKVFVESLLRRLLAPEQRIARLQLQRGVRIFGLVTLIVVAIVSGWLGFDHWSRTPDLALGKKWQTSSETPECNQTERTCNGAPTKMLFHTREEDEPWFEIDLGAPTSFSKVHIENRSDCCADRAIPLAIEVSNDQTAWREVARRTDSFGTWNAKFTPQTARYLRLRALRRTILHLEDIEVRK